MAAERKEVFILGSGGSINSISNEEKDYISGATACIALNKFMAFYKKAGITPSHVFFIDTFSPASTNMLQYIFDLCYEDGLTDTVFITNKKLKNKIYRKKGPGYYWHKYHPISLHRHHAYHHIKAPFNFEFIDYYFHLEGGNWATSMKEKLFHLRSSLTTALNYASIQYPGHVIKLVGVDLNRKNYFFHEELKQLKFSTTDWTTVHTQTNNRHFTVQQFQGTNMLDVIPYMLEKLDETGNTLFCSGKTSLLVEEKHLTYKPIMEA